MLVTCVNNSSGKEVHTVSTVYPKTIELYDGKTKVTHLVFVKTADNKILRCDNKLVPANVTAKMHKIWKNIGDLKRRKNYKRVVHFTTNVNFKHTSHVSLKLLSLSKTSTNKSLATKLFGPNNMIWSENNLGLSAPRWTEWKVFWKSVDCTTTGDIVVTKPIKYRLCSMVYMYNITNATLCTKPNNSSISKHKPYDGKSLRYLQIQIFNKYTKRRFYCGYRTHFTVWSIWTFNCTTGFRTRKRKCQVGVISVNATYCAGPVVNSVSFWWFHKCKNQSGKWTGWKLPYNNCSNCGLNYTMRSRSCLESYKYSNYKFIHENETTDKNRPRCDGSQIRILPCFKRVCPIDGGAGEWLEWSVSCNKSCGFGWRHRKRLCDNPPPDLGGRDCSEFIKMVDVIQCKRKDCRRGTFVMVIFVVLIIAVTSVCGLSHPMSSALIGSTYELVASTSVNTETTAAFNNSNTLNNNSIDKSTTITYQQPTKITNCNNTFRRQRKPRQSDLYMPNSVGVEYSDASLNRLVPRNIE